MRLGICCNPSEGPQALALGYDYVEYPAASAEPSEATNLFFPSDVRLYGPEADGLERGKAIIDAGAARGVRVMVLGSGGVRRDGPEGEFYDLAAALDRHAQTLGLRLAPESLNPGETNVATSLPAMARALAERGAPYTADSYHALVETDTPDGGRDFWRDQLPFAPIHVHFAPFDRSVPTGEEPSLKTFFARLRELGYDGRASLECKRGAIPDPAPLRRLLGGASFQEASLP